MDFASTIITVYYTSPFNVITVSGTDPAVLPFDDASSSAATDDMC